MQRLIEKDLLLWKDRPNRLPLIIRGARQVGKTFVIEQFAAKHFKSFVSINFESQPQATNWFKSLDPENIIQLISLALKQQIIPGETLLFLDEIQSCPMAILALRYFKEKLPGLHVIAAGSLLEFALNNEEISIPVGRVEFLYLKPLSFDEFLLAMGFDQLQNHLQHITLKTPLAEALHHQLLDLTKQYFIVGGMPAVVNDFVERRSWLECQRIQNHLLQTYQYDFGKYAPQTQHKYLQSLFDRAPYLICRPFKYSSVDPEYRSRDIKNALQLLQDAGLIFRVFATAASGLPLRAQINEKKFKILFVDVGLVQRSLQMDSILLQTSPNLLLINAGQLAEQFVGQELLANYDTSIQAHLHYWERHEKSSLAEIDYVINAGSDIIPIEVKAGKTGRLKSLQLFMQEKNSRLGIKISQEPLSFEKNILTIPFYLVAQLPRLILFALTVQKPTGS